MADRDPSFFLEIVGDGAPMGVPSSPSTPPVDRVPARLQDEEKQALRGGFAPAGLLFAMGTALVADGTRAYRESRTSFEDMPFASAALADHTERIRAERRTDVRTPLSSLTMVPSGALQRDPGRAPLPITEDAFRQLVERAGIPYGTGYLTRCPAHLRATNVNYWLTRRAVSAKEVVLRARKIRDEWQGYAIVSPEYTAVDSDVIAKAVAEAIPEHARASVVYDGTRTRINVLFHAPGDMDARVGSNYKAGIQVTSGDTGNACLEVKALLYQAVCVNLTTAARAQDVLSAVHRGNNLQQQLQDAIQVAMSKVEPFVKAWQEAETRSLIEGSVVGGDVEPAIVALVRSRLIPNPGGIKDEELVRRIRSCYWMAPNATVAGVVNAVTRAAHTSSWGSPWAQDELQDAAGEMVWNQLAVENVAMSALSSARREGWKPGRFTLNDVERGVVDTQPVFAFAFAP